MSGFSPIKNDQKTELTKKILLGNSITVALGDVIIAETGTFGLATNANVAGATVPVLGVVVGFTNANGEVLANGDQTSVATGTGATTYAVYIPAFSSQEFYGPLSAVSGTTTGSNKDLVYFNILSGSASQLDETTVTHIGTVGQFLSTRVDPNNSSQVIGRFVVNTWAQYDQVAS